MLIQVLKGCKINVIIKKNYFILIFAKIREKVYYNVNICYIVSENNYSDAEPKIATREYNTTYFNPLYNIETFFINFYFN